MTKEKLVVPKELGKWLKDREHEIGIDFELFTLIEDLIKWYYFNEFASAADIFIKKHKKELIEVIIGTREYEVEEPLVYALVKGHELMGSNLKYWSMGIYQCGLSVLERYVDQDLYSNKKTKSEWAKYGINDSNADFEEVQE